MENFDENTMKNLQSFLSCNYDMETKNEIENLIKTNPDEIKNRFYKKLSFGTAGIRGIMGTGTNRINKYTIRAATQGLANYLKKNSDTNKVVIGYDNRRNSKLFAEESAKVLAANNIKALLFPSLTPTPMVSFACRYKNCNAAIMITASHNPPEYNGYKVYWKDGGQIVPPHDTKIIEEVQKIEDPTSVPTTDLKSPLIEILEDDIYDAYLEKLQTLKTKKTNTIPLNIVYTSLHGTGITILPKALKSWGFENISLVQKQCTADENFTYALKPNPEEKQALSLGINLLKEKNADILLATDPDADRIGVVVSHKNSPVILTGNQIACILLEHILSSTSLNEKSSAVKSVVTTELFSEIAKVYNIKCINVLTGFKYIAEKMHQWELNNNASNEFVFGAEESLGFLRENFVRDKDAISTACLLCEIATKQKEKNQTLIDYLHQIYQKYGVYRESVFSLNFEEGKAGMEKLTSVMKNLRKNPPKQIDNYSIETIEDMQTQKKVNTTLNKVETFEKFPISDVLLFWLNDQTKIVIRPSGTEPKIKVYMGCFEKNVADITKAIASCDNKLQAIQMAVKNLLQV